VLTLGDPDDLSWDAENENAQVARIHSFLME
jgi:hypothetical protein